MPLPTPCCVLLDEELYLMPDNGLYIFRESFCDEFKQYKEGSNGVIKQ